MKGVAIQLTLHVVLSPFLLKYSLNKKEWICSLFKEWILEKSEFGVNICVIHSFWSDHRDHSGIPSDPWGHSKMSE